MEICISDVIRKKRQEKGINQETLAQTLGVSVQAVSKWETGNSMPDITLLPSIAEFFGMDLDRLFFGDNCREIITAPDDVPDDGKLRVMQFIGRRAVRAEEYQRENEITLVFPKEYLEQQREGTENKLKIEIRCGATIKGDINGDVAAGGGINCGDIGGSSMAGGGINCAQIGGSASSGGGINCAQIGGSVSAGGSINCGDVNGNVSSGTTVKCGNVSGNVEGNKVTAKVIDGNAKAGTKLTCAKIKGDVRCSGKIIYMDEDTIVREVERDAEEY